MANGAALPLSGDFLVTFAFALGSSLTNMTELRVLTRMSSFFDVKSSLIFDLLLFWRFDEGFGYVSK